MFKFMTEPVRVVRHITLEKAVLPMTAAARSSSFPNWARFWHSEAESFQYILSTLERALQAGNSDQDRCSKLAHIRFLMTLVQRYLERLLASEEREHLTILKQRVELQQRVNALRLEQSRVRSELTRVIFHLDKACASNQDLCNSAFLELQDVVGHMQQHMHHEVNLLQDTIEPGTGGLPGVIPAESDSTTPSQAGFSERL